MPKQSIIGTPPPNSTEFILYWQFAAEHGAFWGVACIPSETPLEKTKISFASSCQLEIASGLGKGVHIHIPFQG